MIGFAYLAALTISLGGMLLIDRRFRLFFWKDPLAAAIVTVVGMAFFLAWDAVGIARGVFLRGDSPFATGIVLAPELPLEEPVFLLFLSVCTMILFPGSVRVLDRRKERR